MAVLRSRTTACTPETLSWMMLLNLHSPHCCLFPLLHRLHTWAVLFGLYFTRACKLYFSVQDTFRVTSPVWVLHMHVSILRSDDMGGRKLTSKLSGKPLLPLQICCRKKLFGVCKTRTDGTLSQDALGFSKMLDLSIASDFLKSYAALQRHLHAHAVPYSFCQTTTDLKQL